MRNVLRPKAIVFDLDNTLVESAVDFQEMRRRVVAELERCGAPRHLVDTEKTVLTNIREGRNYLSRLRDESYLLDLDMRLGGILTDCELSTLPMVKVVEGAHDALAMLESQGLALGVLTRGSRPYASAALRKVGLDEVLQHMVCRDDHPLEEAKPNPLAMQRIASKLGVHARECLYVGDHLIDLECARAAGSAFVGVLTGVMTVEEWRKHTCPQVVRSVADIPSTIALHGAR